LTSSSSQTLLLRDFRAGHGVSRASVLGGARDRVAGFEDAFLAGGHLGAVLLLCQGALRFFDQKLERRFLLLMARETKGEGGN